MSGVTRAVTKCRLECSGKISSKKYATEKVSKKPFFYERTHCD